MGKFVVGLGNPGKEYEQTRHNIGFVAADAIHKEHGFSAWKSKEKALISSGTIGGEDVWLMKPQTFMNLSGRAVAPFAQFHKIPLDDIYVIHDEIELIPAKVRIKQGGGNAGHNGLKSLDSMLGASYWRVRMGVGRPIVAEDVEDYVLERFKKGEQQWVEKLCDALAVNTKLLLSGQHGELMNRLVAAIKPPKEDEA